MKIVAAVLGFVLVGFGAFLIFTDGAPQTANTTSQQVVQPVENAVEPSGKLVEQTDVQPPEVVHNPPEQKRSTINDPLRPLIRRKVKNGIWLERNPSSEYYRIWRYSRRAGVRQIVETIQGGVAYTGDLNNDKMTDVVIATSHYRYVYCTGSHTDQSVDQLMKSASPVQNSKGAPPQ